MSRRVSVLVLLLGAVLTVGCSMHVLVTPNIPRPDSITQPALARFMSSVVTPTIVLRVPRPVNQLSQAATPAGEFSRTYNLIEKELVRAGFTVRDRGLLEEVLRSTQNLDYRIIQDKIGAQLILEIVSIEPRQYDTDQYASAKGGETGRLQKGVFAIGGWLFECKVILVNTGEVGGMYTFYMAPKQVHFVLSGDKVFNADEQGTVDMAHTGYGVPLDEMAKPFVERLVAQLKSSAR
jgi:hypothetical protein